MLSCKKKVEDSRCPGSKEIKLMELNIELLSASSDSVSSVRNGRVGKQMCLEEQHNDIT